MSWATDPAAPACTATYPAPRDQSDEYRHPDAAVETIAGPPTADGYATKFVIRRCPYCGRQEPV